MSKKSLKTVEDLPLVITGEILPRNNFAIHTISRPQHIGMGYGPPTEHTYMATNKYLLSHPNDIPNETEARANAFNDPTNRYTRDRLGYNVP